MRQPAVSSHVPAAGAGDVVARLGRAPALPPPAPVGARPPRLQRLAGAAFTRRPAPEIPTPAAEAPAHAVDDWRPGSAVTERATADGGAPLPAPTRARFETAFGADLSGVRVHTGSLADEAVRRHGARAMTTGRDVLLRSGEYRPGTSAGDRLLAHEVTHVLQQRDGLADESDAVGPALDAVDSGPGDPLEQEAARNAGAWAAGGQVSVRGAGSVRGSGARVGSTAARVVQHDDGDDDVDPVAAEVARATELLQPEIAAVLAEASSAPELDLEATLPEVVDEVLTDRDSAAVARARTRAAEIAGIEESVDVPPHGLITYAIPDVLHELALLHAEASGLTGVAASAGVRQVIRAMSGHAAQAIAHELPGSPSFAPLYAAAVRHDVVAAATAIHDATALLRLELEGTISELLELRQAFATASDEAERAQAGAAIGQAARQALLLNGALDEAAGGPGAGGRGAGGPTALDTAVEARAADIARIRHTAETESATRTALGDDVRLLGVHDVTIRHGETDDVPIEPIGQPEHAETNVQPEEAFPETTDTAERTMAGELADRIREQRDEVRRLRAQILPEHPTYALDEFTAVHRHWFGMYSLAQEQQDPIVRLVLDLMGEPYQLMGADLGSAMVSVEGGIARSFLMLLGVDLMAGSMHGETTEFGGQVEGGRPRRRTSLGGTASAPEFRYGEMYAGPYDPGRRGEVRSRTDLATRRTGETAAAATALAATPVPLRTAQARWLGLVTGPEDVPLVGVRSVRAAEGWTYLTDVRAVPDGALVAREQKTVSPEVLAYVLAARQQAATLGATHVPTSGGRPIGSRATRTGGVEAAPADSEARYLEGRTSPSAPSEVSALATQLAAAQRETGVRPGRRTPDAAALLGSLQLDLRAYLDAFFVEHPETEWRLAAVFALANTEHGIGATITALLEPERLAMMIGEAVKISAIVMTLQALGPLGQIAARAYQAHLAAQGVSNVAALISIAAFCRNAADAGSLARARAWGYMSRNIVQDASELFENLVSTPVTAGMHALASARSAPSTPQQLAEAMGPLMADPVARDAVLREVDTRIAELEAGHPDTTHPEIEALRAFRDSLEGVSRPETAMAAEAALPGRAEAAVPASFFTAPRLRSEAETAALRAALPAELGSVPIVESGAAGNGVRVRYGDDGGIRLEVGRDVAPHHVRWHARTVRELRRYEGVLGRIRVLLSRVWQAITGHPGYGTRGFEARLEVRKLNTILAELADRQLAVESRANRLMRGDPAELARESEAITRDIAAIEAQLAHHERNVGSYEAGRGFVAAESTLRTGGGVSGFPLRDSAAMAAADQRLRTVEATLARNPALRTEFAGAVRALRIDYAQQRDVFLDLSPDTSKRSGGMRALAASERAVAIERQAADMLRQLEEASTRPPTRAGFDNTAFVDRMRRMPTTERVAFIEQTAGQVAATRGMEYDAALSALNDRSVYRDPRSGELYAVDTLHGSFERCGSNGRHLEEVRFDFTHLDDRDTTGGHDLTVP